MTRAIGIVCLLFALPAFAQLITAKEARMIAENAPANKMIRKIEGKILKEAKEGGDYIRVDTPCFALKQFETNGFRLDDAGCVTSPPRCICQVNW